MAAGSPTLDLPVHTIARARTRVPVQLGELWEYRELLGFLVWREIKIRYKQTALGVAWAVLQPLMTTLVFSVFFGRLGKLPSDGVPYPVFTLSALLPWQLFAFALTESSNSIVANQRLITKVYFPRLIMPLAAVCVGLVDFVVSLGIVAAMLVYYRIPVHPALLTLPLWTLLAMMTAFGAGLWLSSLNVKYRDVRYTLPFLTQLWLLGTPVAYPTSIVPAAWRGLYALNPMVGVVDGFRWALLGHTAVPIVTIVVSSFTAAVAMITGLFYFRHTERSFADVV